MKGVLLERVAVVTGAAMGIGQTVAVRLAQEGAHVVAADIDREKLADTAKQITGLDRRCLPYRIDLAQPAEIRAMFERAVAEFGRLDILVNVAGVLTNLPFLDISVQEWDRVLNVNLRGTFLCMQAAAAQMISQVPDEVKRAQKAERSYGKIVSFSSISGRRGRAVQAHYAATKAAIISLTQSAALAFAPYNINVNAVAPSVVMTPMWERIAEEKSRIFGIEAKRVSDEFVERIPLRRPGSPMDMAEAVVFLCSPASDYITGQTLNVDGGFEMN